MNRERMKELLPVMKAFADGKEVQLRASDGQWEKCVSPQWVEWCEYRIAPAPPRSLFLIEDGEGHVAHRPVTTREGLDGLVMKWNTNLQRRYRVVEYKEVMQD